MLETGVYSINVAALIKEMEQLHASRKFRTFTSTDVISNFQKRMIVATLENSAHRSRIVEIKVMCFKVNRLLKEHIKITYTYISTKYQSDLKIAFSTAKAREDAINSILEEFIKLSEKLNTAIEIAEFIIKDIDQSYFSMTLLQKVMEQSFKREA